MRIQMALLYSGIAALAATVPIAGAAAAPGPTPTPTPSALPIGNVNVKVTQPGQTPSGATHIEKPPIR
ncbi:MAG: hypothetical protein FJZ01_14445 [Candidatus Sericytochromatia bacterium]|nr:hypothetical protein [Candidatus Tanganyikabacteria bacterium]